MGGQTGVLSAYILAGIFLFVGIFALIKGRIPVIGFEEYFSGAKGKLISVVVIILGLYFGYLAALAPNQANNIVRRIEGACVRTT